LKAKATYEKKKTENIVAAVFEDDMDSDEYTDGGIGSEEGDEYVPYQPSFPTHLRWTCCVDAPFTCAPTPVSALIDHGSAPVLISEELVEILGMDRRKLFKPISVSGAFAKRKETSLLLTEYCKLHLQSPDANWTSRVLNAVICPRLHTDIILGLDFLIKNKIVVDAELRTAIAKESGFDLLNPPDPTKNRKNPVCPPQVLRKKEQQEIENGRRKTKKAWTQVLTELHHLFARNTAWFNFEHHSVGPPNVVAAIKTRIAQLAGESVLKRLDRTFKASFEDRFPIDIPHVGNLPKDVYHHIELKPGSPISTARAYSCPRKYRAGWKTLIDQHVAAGRIHPSSSPYTSPSFIIPKADPSVLPRWVNDYCHLNRLTVPDNYPLPRIDDILANCGKGKIWRKIDMTNSFFQTLVNPDHIKYTATLTPFGLWEWVVMPMGLRNSPATHQRQVTLALRELIGQICHVYLDDIIIWSSSLAEHKVNVALVLEALRKAELYCSLKKSCLFATEIDFLGHHISAKGIEASTEKVE
jgi:hypothetical protein